MLKKTTKTKTLSFANQLLLKRLEIAGFNEVVKLTSDNPQQELDALVLGRELIHGPNGSKRNKYSAAFTDGVLNDQFSIDQGERTRSQSDVTTFQIIRANPTSDADLAIGTSIAFAIGQTQLFSEESVKVSLDQKKATQFRDEVASQIRPNVFKTIGKFTVDHKQPNGLSTDTTKNVRSAAQVYKLLDELIKLYEDKTLTNNKNRSSAMQQLLTEAFVIAEKGDIKNEDKVEMILAKSRSLLSNENKNVGKFSLSGFFQNKSVKQTNTLPGFATELRSIISTHDPHQKALSAMTSKMGHLTAEKDMDSANNKMIKLHEKFINYIKTHHLDDKPEYRQPITVFNNVFRKSHEQITSAVAKLDEEVTILPKPETKRETKSHDEVEFVHPKDTKYPVLERNKKMIVNELQKLNDADLLSPKTKTTISAIIKCLKSNPVNEQQFEVLIQGACKRRNIMQKKGLITKDVGKQFTKVLNALNELHNEDMSPKKFDSILRHEFKHLKETRLDAQNLTSTSRLRY